MLGEAVSRARTRCVPRHAVRTVSVPAPNCNPGSRCFLPRGHTPVLRGACFLQARRTGCSLRHHPRGAWGTAPCIFPDCDFSLHRGILAAAPAKNSRFRSGPASALPMSHAPLAALKALSRIAVPAAGEQIRWGWTSHGGNVIRPVFLLGEGSWPHSQQALGKELAAGFW